MWIKFYNPASGFCSAKCHNTFIVILLLILNIISPISYTEMNLETKLSIKNTYTKLVSKYQINVISSCKDKCNENVVGGQKDTMTTINQSGI